MAARRSSSRACTQAVASCIRFVSSGMSKRCSRVCRSRGPQRMSDGAPSVVGAPWTFSGRGRWALELDRVAFGIAQVQRWAFALGAVARARFARCNAVRGQVRAQGGLIVGLDAQAEVIE